MSPPESPKLITDLPDELVGEIGQQLSPETRLSLRILSPALATIIAARCVHRLRVRNAPRAKQALRVYTGIQTLEAHGNPMPRFSSDGLDVLGLATAIHSSAAYTSGALQTLLISNPILDCAHIKQLRNLRTLISNCSTIRNPGLAYLQHFPDLKRVEFHRVTSVDDSGLAHIAKCGQLQTLQIATSQSPMTVQITDAGLAHVARLANLEALHLSSMPKITDAGLASLRTLKNIEKLHLTSCYAITDTGLAVLGHFPRLKDLNLGYDFKIGDEGLAHIAKLRDLQSLNLASCRRITDGGLAKLSKLRKLRSLDLSSCVEITDVGIAHLRKLTDLRSLTIHRCAKVTDAGLAKLHNLTQLQTLNHAHCPAITSAGREPFPGLVP